MFGVVIQQHFRDGSQESDDFCSLIPGGVLADLLNFHFDTRPINGFFLDHHRSLLVDVAFQACRLEWPKTIRDLHHLFNAQCGIAGAESTCGLIINFALADWNADQSAELVKNFPCFSCRVG